MHQCFRVTISSENTLQAQMIFNILIHEFSCLGSVRFCLVCVPAGDSSIQLCFMAVTPARAALYGTADKQEIEKQMH